MSNLDDRFVEVEKRVKAIVKENAGLRKRVRDLEQELAKVRRDSHEFENFRGKKMHITEKIERILRTLDSLGEKNKAEG